MSSPAIRRVGRSDDHPAGTLPDGTVHWSPIGEMEIGPDHARCHLCGGWFRSVGVHLRSHGWDREHYRATFGLERSQPLEGASTQAARARALTRRRDRDPRVKAGCEIGLRLVVSGELTRAAAESSRGRRQPEQRRRKTRRTLSAISARAEATTRASVARLTAIGADAARAAGYPTIGELVLDRVRAGASLAQISRAAGLHKDWLCRHLETIDPVTAAEVGPLVSGRRAVRHDSALHPRVVALGFDDVAAFLRRRHLDEHLTSAAIAAELGVSRPAVDAAFERHGVPYRTHATSRRRSDERADAVAARFGFERFSDYLDARRATGTSWRRIAAECGEPATWVRRRADLARRHDSRSADR